MELDEFTDYVSEVLDNEIPQEIQEGLNLGVIVSPDINKCKEEQQYIIMGVYVQNRLGKQIIIYYGSFLYFYEDKSDEVWKRKILATIKHEFIHHIEALSGQEDLAKKERYEASHRKKIKKKDQEK